MRVAALLVYATLAYAFWQRACDRLPWLLDPVDHARAEVSLSDAAAAVVVFFLVQILVLLLLLAGKPRTTPVPLLPVVIAFVVAGATTVLMFAAILGGRGVGVSRALGLRIESLGGVARSVLAGCLVGALAGAIGLAYGDAVRRFDWFEIPTLETTDTTTLLVLACVAAPLFEEIIFRGLLFSGLRRSVSLHTAIPWSAALFAAVHPVQSWFPVFVLGLGAAYVFHRTGALLAAMVAHAVYNAIVLLVTI